MNDKREIFGWTMYDWANSAFSTTVVTSLLGPYIDALASSSDNPISLLGFVIQPAAIYPTAVSLSVGLQVFILPLLGTLADYTNLKKRLLLTFAYLGAISTMLMFLVRTDMPVLGTNGAVILASSLFILANLSFGAAIVFYNAYLPDIVPPDQRDATSSRGFAFGYLGGGLNLLLALLLINFMEDTALAVRISLASAGLWWLIFTYLFPHQRLVVREPVRKLPKGASLWTIGFKEIGHTLTTMWREYPQTLLFLGAYLIYNDGIQTVISVSTLFAAGELGVETSMLLLLVLMIQFIGFFGAMGFGWLAGRIGAKKSIMLSLVIWVVLVVYAYFFLYTQNQLFVMCIFLALVLGGSQALSRSLFSQMIPKDRESEYFGFYEISERGTSWIGPIVFATVVQWTNGEQRPALVSLIIFFVVGLFLLTFVDVRRAIKESGNDPEGVVL